jgi:hypothetical protein
VRNVDREARSHIGRRRELRLIGWS